jgi:hypothetical protein
MDLEEETNERREPEPEPLKYNLQLLCSYLFYDEDLMDYNPYSHDYKKEIIALNDEESKEDKATWCDILYKNELETAFNSMNDNDSDNENDIVKKIDVLFDYLYSSKNEHSIAFFEVIQNDNKPIIPLYNNPEVTNDSDKEILRINFHMLFSYPLFHITHLCIVDLIQHKEVKEENMEYMRKILKSEIFFI